jgi:hypothetical protein
MVTGTPPYPGSSIPDIIKQQLTAPLPPVRSRNPEITEATATLIEKMMAKDRNLRHRDWDELIADIDDILAAQFPESAPAEVEEPPAAPSPRRSRRKPLLLVLLAFLVAMGAMDYWLMTTPGAAARLRTRLHSFLAPRPVSTPAATNKTNQAITKAVTNAAPTKPFQPPPARPLPPITSSNAFATLFETGRPKDFINLISRRLERASQAGLPPPPLRDVPADRQTLVASEMRALDDKAAPLIRIGKLRAAASIYENYNGPVARETVVLRKCAFRLLHDEAGHPGSVLAKP